MKNRISRKKFIALSAMSSLGLMAGCATASARRVPPDGKLRHACIGVRGMMGGGDLENFKSHSRLEIVAICDVDKNYLADAGKELPNARQYTDWRELLAQEGDNLDSVNVTVPDHMHAIIALTFIRAGKHVYCQKPLAHDVAECRALAQAAKKAGVVTQLGTQFAAGMGDRLTVQLLQRGVIGKIKRVVLCSNRPGAVEAYRLVGPRPAQGSPAPPELNWDLWIGTAPARPYAPKIYHPSLWRSWQDFGTGWSGDIGCHIFDAVWKGLGLTAPLSVVAEFRIRGAIPRNAAPTPGRRATTSPGLFPGAMTAEAELPVEWFDGDKYPPADVQKIALSDPKVPEYPPESAMLLGTEGALLLPHQSMPFLLPREKFQDVPRSIAKGPSHYHRFVDACLGGEPTASPFIRTGPMAEAIILGTVAVRVPGQALQWDAKHMRIPNHPEAERLLRRAYRKGWEVKL